jgi:hypothetical protein
VWATPAWSEVLESLVLQLYLKALIFLPSLSLLMLVGSDIDSLLSPSPFRDSCELLWAILTERER